MKGVVETTLQLAVQKVAKLENGLYEIKQTGWQMEKKDDRLLFQDRIVHLTTTRTNFGERKWFKCPECAKNTGRLFFTDKIACRKCCNLVYNKQNLTYKQNYERSLKDKIEMLQQRLQITEDNCSYILSVNCWLWRNTFDKPKNMHWATFGKLQGELADTQLELHYFLSRGDGDI